MEPCKVGQAACPSLECHTQTSSLQRLASLSHWRACHLSLWQVRAGHVHQSCLSRGYQICGHNIACRSNAICLSQGLQKSMETFCQEAK